jgi:hypothetical protein
VVVTEGETTIEFEVEPVFQEYVFPPEAVNVALAPAHMIPSLLETPELSEMTITGGCWLFTVMVVVAVAVQLDELVTVTV